MIHTFLNLLFPPRSDPAASAPDCSGLIPVRLRQQDLRGQGIMHLDGVTAAAAYASSKDLQAMIRRFKYGRQRLLAVPLGHLIADATATFPIDDETVLCPVPLHWSRRFSRGFNQAELLAREVSASTDLPLVSALRRVRPTGRQAWRSHDERRLAMHDAFVADTSGQPHVTLVDDVATTMSTLDACACALKNAGAAHVDAIVIALG